MVDELGAFHRETAWIEEDDDNGAINESMMSNRVDAIGIAVGERERQTLLLSPIVLLFRIFIVVVASGWRLEAGICPSTVTNDQSVRQR